MCMWFALPTQTHKHNTQAQQQTGKQTHKQSHKRAKTNKQAKAQGKKPEQVTTQLFVES